MHVVEIDYARHPGGWRPLLTEPTREEAQAAADRARTTLTDHILRVRPETEQERADQENVPQLADPATCAHEDLRPVRLIGFVVPAFHWCETCGSRVGEGLR
ncbi:hypothetical protein ACIRPH_30990 [Nocardiopsis sp. NPDC101807]|uniref:hypothetical protein n=1 Tax=Nocardiopsis sp. NPDC101807 TaxID=3364339 RepID=UPI003808282E